MIHYLCLFLPVLNTALTAFTTQSLFLSFELRIKMGLWKTYYVMSNLIGSELLLSHLICFALLSSISCLSLTAFHHSSVGHSCFQRWFLWMPWAPVCSTMNTCIHLNDHEIWALWFWLGQQETSNHGTLRYSWVICSITPADMKHQGCPCVLYKLI